MPSNGTGIQNEGAVAPSAKRTWIAVVLAVGLFPSFGMLYLGRGWRALLYLALYIATAGVPFVLALVGLWPRGLPWWFILIPVYVGAAIDAHRLAKADGQHHARPWYSRWYGLTVVLLLIMLFSQGMREFLIEPFRIPSGAMMPTLLVGDNILVNKLANLPSRGEVMVFHYPENRALLYIKRVVGLPGDKVDYGNKQLAINGKPAVRGLESDYSYVSYVESTSRFVWGKHLTETTNGRTYSILITPDTPPIQLTGVRAFPLRENCQFSEAGFTCRVPAGHYFVLGDNRDSSSDSRYWGFVPEANVVGRAFMIWWNTDAPERTGTSIQ